MELEQVDVIGFHALQAQVDVCGGSRLVASLALGGEHDVLAHVGERKTDLFLAVGVAVGGVEVVDAALVSRAQNGCSVLRAAALNGQAAHGRLGDEKPGAAERNFLHSGIPSLSRKFSGRDMVIWTQYSIPPEKLK